jgi:hypothetical protein
MIQITNDDVGGAVVVDDGFEAAADATGVGLEEESFDEGTSEVEDVEGSLGESVERAAERRRTAIARRTAWPRGDDEVGAVDRERRLGRVWVEEADEDAIDESPSSSTLLSPRGPSLSPPGPRVGLVGESSCPVLARRLKRPPSRAPRCIVDGDVGGGGRRLCSAGRLKVRTASSCEIDRTPSSIIGVTLRRVWGNEEVGGVFDVDADEEEGRLLLADSTEEEGKAAGFEVRDVNGVVDDLSASEGVTVGDSAGEAFGAVLLEGDGLEDAPGKVWVAMSRGAKRYTRMKFSRAASDGWDGEERVAAGEDSDGIGPSWPVGEAEDDDVDCCGSALNSLRATTSSGWRFWRKASKDPIGGRTVVDDKEEGAGKSEGWGGAACIGRLLGEGASVGMAGLAAAVEGERDTDGAVDWSIELVLEREEGSGTVDEVWRVGRAVEEAGMGSFLEIEDTVEDGVEELANERVLGAMCPAASLDRPPKTLSI